MSGFGRRLQRVGQGGKLFLTPGTGTYSLGNTIVITIHEDSQSVPVSSVQANLTYDPAMLQYQSNDTSMSAFDTTLQHTGGSGSVQIAVGSLSGSRTGINTVATVTFTVVGSGNTTVTFAGSSALYRSPDAVNILKTTSGAAYTV